MSVEQKRDEDFLDTMIALLLSFGMAIGVWLYAVKPGSSHLSGTVPAESGQKLVPYSYPEGAGAAGARLDEQAALPPQIATPELAAPVIPMGQTDGDVCPKLNKKAEPLTAECPAPRVMEVPNPAPEASSVTAAPPTPVAPVPVQPPQPAVVPEPAPAEPKVIIRESIPFAYGSAVIPKSARPQLRKIAQVLSGDNRKLKIVGHTDNIGNQEENLMLSLQRAEAVKNYLISQGVVADRLSTEGVGATQPIADNATEEGRRQNRRIEITE